VLIVADWSRRYADRIDSWHMPSAKAKQDELALHYAEDGYTLLEALHAPPSPAWLRELPAVQTLRIVLLQNYTRTTSANGHVRIRRREQVEDAGDGLPPGPIRLASPYDTDTRWSAKHDLFWNGYKLHVSQTRTPQVDGDRPDRPNIITNVTTTASGLRGGPAGGLAQSLGPHDHALAVHLDHQRHLAAARNRNPGPVEVVDVDRGGDHEPFQPALAEHFPTAALDRIVRLVERAAVVRFHLRGSSRPASIWVTPSNVGGEEPCR
jgi:hypothetical protein